MKTPSACGLVSRSQWSSWPWRRSATSRTATPASWWPRAAGWYTGHTVIEQTGLVQELIEEAEVHECQYVITGDKHHLGPYEDSLVRLDQAWGSWTADPRRAGGAAARRGAGRAAGPQAGGDGGIGPPARQGNFEAARAGSEGRGPGGPRRGGPGDGGLEGGRAEGAGGARSRRRSPPARPAGRSSSATGSARGPDPGGRRPVRRGAAGGAGRSAPPRWTCARRHPHCPRRPRRLRQRRLPQAARRHRGAARRPVAVRPVHPDPRPPSAPASRRWSPAAGPPDPPEAKVTARQGGLVDVEVAASPFADQGGTAVRWCCTT